MARPVVLAGANGRPVSPHPLLLSEITSKVAWADIGILVVLLLAWELLVAVGLGLALGVALGGGDADIGLDDGAFQRLAAMPALILRALGALVIVALIVRNRRGRRGSVGLCSQKPVLDILLGSGSVPVLYGLTLLWVVLAWALFPELYRQLTENAGRITAVLPRLHPLTFGAVALTVGLYEELVFRGFLMPRIRRATGSWTLAVVGNTVLFTSLHWFDQTPAAMVPIAMISLVFSLVTVWRKSILPAIIGHFLFNWAQFLGLYYFVADDSWV